MKKIAIFSLQSLIYGAGSEKYFIQLAKSLCERGTKANIVTLDEPSHKRLIRLYDIYFKFNFFGELPKSLVESREDFKKILGAVVWNECPFSEIAKQLKQYDAIYTKNDLVELSFLKMIGHKKLPPIIAGIHTPLVYGTTESLQAKLHNLLYTGIFYKWLLNGITLVHAPNKFTQEFVLKTFKLPVKFIYNPFDTNEYRQRAEKYPTLIQFDASKYNIAFVARLAEQKGINSLIKIIEQLAQDYLLSSQIALNIFGTGPDEALVTEAQDKYAFVRYHGAVSTNYIPSILNHCKLFISTAKWEVLPYNILEAQAMGLPVLAYNIPGPQDIIENYKTGLLLNSEEEFAINIRKAVNKELLFDSQTIINNVTKKFLPKTIFDNLKEMIESVYL